AVLVDQTVGPGAEGGGARRRLTQQQGTGTSCQRQGDNRAPEPKPNRLDGHYLVAAAGAAVPCPISMAPCSADFAALPSTGRASSTEPAFSNTSVTGTASPSTKA